MSKRGYFSRYSIILKKLKPDSYCSFKDLKRYFDDKIEDLRAWDDTVDVDLQIRTFQRDINEIRNNFGIDIEYSRAHKGYYIKQRDREDHGFRRMMEAFDVFNTLNMAKDYTPFIHFEQRPPQGTDNLQGMIHAIKNSLIVSFTYQKFWEDEMRARAVIPLALKEFRDRWYLLAKDQNDGKIKTFALDRITGFDITKKKFQNDDSFDVAKHYQNFFGIISPDHLKPERIILSFNTFQGKYIKSLPLHESQRTIIDNEEELQIELNLCITHDFVMELLSFGNNVKVLQPQNLAQDIKKAHYEAYLNYE